MPAKIKINFSTGELNGCTMNLVVMAGKQTVFKHSDNLSKKFTVEFDTNIPEEIKFIVNGKGPFDTKVDEQGNILQDKFLKIDSIQIDRMLVPTWILENKLIRFVYNDQVTYTNYFGYNGQGIIQIPKSTFLMFLELQTTG